MSKSRKRERLRNLVLDIHVLAVVRHVASGEPPGLYTVMTPAPQLTARVDTTPQPRLFWIPTVRRWWSMTTCFGESSQGYKYTLTE